MQAQVVGLYARLSKLKGKDESIATQLRRGRELIERQWPGATVREYRDPDKSAADPDVFRPDFHRLLGDTAAGELTQVVAADQERLTRQVAEFEVLSQVLRRAGIDGFHGYRDGYTPVKLGQTAGGRYKAVGAAEYVEGVKLKVHERLDEKARAGEPAGAKVFGFKHVTLPDGRTKSLERVPDEAATVREMADSVLVEGRGAHAVALDLNARGVATPRGGKRWHDATVRRVLTAPTQAGLRVHRGEVIGAGNWPPILTVDEHQQLVARLSGQGRTGPRPMARRYLLSGFLRCRRCDGERMRGNWHQRGTHDYRCPVCGQGVSGEHADAHVLRELLPRLGALAELLRLGDDHEQRRADLLRELARVGDKRRLYGRLLAADEMDDETYQEARQALFERERGLAVELADLPTPEAVVSPYAARQALAGSDLAARRTALAQYVERIDVRPSGRTGRVFDEDRLTVVTRAPRLEDAAAALLPGRRSYVEQTSGERPDLATARRFLELSEVGEFEPRVVEVERA